MAVPKYNFDQEPYVVFLYKLLGVDTLAAMSMDQWDEVITRSLIACYRDPSKVFIPASFEELDSCLDTIQKRKAGIRAAIPQDV